MRSTSFLAIPLLAFAATAFAQRDAKEAPPVATAAKQDGVQKGQLAEKALSAPQVDKVQADTTRKSPKAVGAYGAKGMKEATVVAPAGTDPANAQRVSGAPGEIAGTATPSAEAVSNARAIAQQMVATEQKHRELQARMDRLLTVFGEMNESDKVGELKGLRAQENKRYSAAMDGYKVALGPELFGKVVAAMNGGSPGAAANRGAMRDEAGAGANPRRGKRQARGG